MVKGHWIAIITDHPPWGEVVRIYKPGLRLAPGSTGKLVSITKDGPVFESVGGNVTGVTHWEELSPVPHSLET